MKFNHLSRIALLLTLIGFAACLSSSLAADKKSDAKKEAEYPDPKRFEKSILAFEQQDKENPPPKGAVVAAGSSSIRQWHETIQKDLAPITVVPRGFGGSTMFDALHYADRIILPYKPRAVLLYEGDNDISKDIPPAKVRDTFKALVARIHESLPEARIYFIAIKPSVKRWEMWPRMRRANRMIRNVCGKDKRLFYLDIAVPMIGEAEKPPEDIFKPDMLHLNEKGYALWTKVIRPVLVRNEGKYEKKKSKN